ncbi:hypothetical protein ACN08Y_05145 [Rothia sp. P5764]|uniref:phosphoribosyltransferase-like protein n=1 Tax=Rothia sp. P5764 TaxID=3402654 RepID=UPI003AD2E5E6
MYNETLTWSEATELWLNNFHGEYKKYALQFIKEIDVYSTERIQLAIRQKINNIIYSLGSDELIVFYPIVDISSKKKIKFSDQFYNWRLDGAEYKPLAFSDYTPQESIIGISPGSEAQISHWIRNTILDQEDSRKNKILPADKLSFSDISEFIQQGKKIKFVCVTDMSLSGDEAVTFGKSFRNSPIWKIYREKLEINLLCFAISEAALDALREEQVFDKFYYEYFTKSIFDLKWLDYEEINGIANLCKTLGGRKLKPKQRKEILGYKDSGNMAITDFFLPNNTPSILYANKRLANVEGFSWIFSNRYSAYPRRYEKNRSQKIALLEERLMFSSGYKYIFNHAKSKSEKYKISLLYYLMIKKFQASNEIKGNPDNIKKYLRLRFSDICILLNENALVVEGLVRKLKDQGYIIISSHNPDGSILYGNPVIELSPEFQDFSTLPYEQKRYFSRHNLSGVSNGIDSHEYFYYPRS